MTKAVLYLIFFAMMVVSGHPIFAEVKKVVKIIESSSNHWVGDGFPVRSVFSYNQMSGLTTPFLLLDYAEPSYFPPSDKQLGVDFHPHRGFETVTISYQGDVAHKDSHGNEGVIGPGDVQWMTAGKGVLHEEKHGPNLRQNGGTLEMVQLWVNLPAKDKMVAPAYQAITSQQIPTVSLDQGTLRVIAGDYKGAQGPAKTHTPINLYDIKLQKGALLPLHLPSGYTTLAFILRGEALFNGEKGSIGQLVLFDRQGDEMTIQAQEDVVILLMNGQPINEPVVGRGPFVMNTEKQIQQAFQDFQDNKF